MSPLNQIIEHRPGILVVDDTPDNLSMISSVLSDSYPVRVANSGRKALMIAGSERPPALILLDIMMPDMDGYETCRQLKLNPDTCGIPVIFLTAKADAEDEEHGLALGAVDYITKPVNPAILLARIRTQLALKAATDYLRDENRNLEAQVAKRTQQAFYDELTKLPNRRLLSERMEVAQTISKRSNQFGALMYLDMDKFKLLNDTKGHDYGDLLLREVANRLNACVRDADAVARMGGDEFVVVVEMLGQCANEAAAQAEILAEKIRHALNQPYQLRDYKHHSSPSIGVVLFRGMTPDIPTLIKQADSAMYQAKQAGRNSVRFFDPVLQADLKRRMALEAELYHALARREFRLYYQVQVDRNLQPHGVEALLRWEHPQRGLLTPEAFLSPLEGTDLIISTGAWVLATACQQLATWANNPLTAHLSIAVNISAKQFRAPDFVQDVQDILLNTGAKPEKLLLEFTESVALDHVDAAIVKMHALKALGVRLSMDDFGMGYSSLRYLKQLHLDQVKIDQSFIAGIEQSSDDEAIVRTIIAMGKALGLKVIAEGVETPQQWKFLDRHGCDIFQGYLFRKPKPAEVFTHWLSLQNTAGAVANS